jgi:Mrp family chromosome partitioning ATPase
VDGVLLVIEPGRTKLPVALQSVEMLRRSGARLLGAVFNNVPSRRAGYYGAYRYQYAYESSGANGRSVRSSALRTQKSKPAASKDAAG